MDLNARQMQALQQLFRQQQAQDDGIVAFRAGRMYMDESRMVHARKERGKIKFYRSDDGLLHLDWTDRISKKSDLDIMIFPDSAKWIRVNECKDGRVYVLKFNGSSRREFFWMQEPDESKDEEIVKKINETISSKNDSSSSNNASSSAAATSSAAQQTAPNYLQNLFGIGAPNAAAGGAAGGGASNAGGQPDLTQMFLQAIQQQAGGGGNNNNAGNANNNGSNIMQDLLRAQLAQREALEKEPDLVDILDPNSNDEIRRVLDDEKVVDRLSEHLPQSMRSREDIIEQLTSPQFLSSVNRLNRVVNGPQMQLLLQQMGINQVQNVGVTSFIRAITEQNGNNDNSNNNNNSNNNSNNNNNSDSNNNNDKNNNNDNSDNNAKKDDGSK